MPGGPWGSLREGTGEAAGTRYSAASAVETVTCDTASCDAWGRAGGRAGYMNGCGRGA